MSFRFHGLLCPGCGVSWDFTTIHPPPTEATGAIMDANGVTPTAMLDFACPRCFFKITAVFTEESCVKTAEPTERTT